MLPESNTLHILCFPFMAPGHIIPMVDMAKLFASHGVKSTIMTTPGNAHLIQPSIDHANLSGYQNPIQLSLIPFPCVENLPKGCENLSALPEGSHRQFFWAMEKLREPFENALSHISPDCIVTDIFLPWTADSAIARGIPRIVFHGSNYFAQCAQHNIEKYNPIESLSEGEERFVVPNLPHRIELSKSMIPDFRKLGVAEIFQQVKEAELKSYGTVMNSYYELESDYIDYYRNVMGKKSWHIGPLSLCNKDVAKSGRGNKASIDSGICLKWLNSKSPRSVIYVCFGSMSDITTKQLQEMALGLEASTHAFIWVVRKASDELWMPEGFEERVEGKGLVIRGWAPQVLILNHGSVGGFMTHCGWNSTLEGVSAGLPFVTCPLFAEQFYNERFIVDVLKIGVTLGMDEYSEKPESRKVIDAAGIERAVKELMDGGEEADARRRRAKVLGDLAVKALEKDGSSYKDMTRLIEELIDGRANV